MRWEVVNAALGGLQSWSALDDRPRHRALRTPTCWWSTSGTTRPGRASRRTSGAGSIRAGSRGAHGCCDTRALRALSRILPARAASHMHRPAGALRPLGDVNVPADARRRARDAGRSGAERRRCSGARLAEMVRTMRAVGARTMLLTLSQNFSRVAARALVAPARAPARARRRPGGRARARGRRAGAAATVPAALAAWSRRARPRRRLRRAPVQGRELRADPRPARCGERALPPWRAISTDIPQGAPTSLNDIIREVARQRGRDPGRRRPRVHPRERAAPGRQRPLRRFGAREPPRPPADRARSSRTRSGRPGWSGPQVRWNPDAYVDPDPEALLDADPDLRFRESITRSFACQAAGRPGCDP